MLSGTQYTPIGGLDEDLSAGRRKAGSKAEVIREQQGQHCVLAVTPGLQAQRD